MQKTSLFLLILHLLTPMSLKAIAPFIGDGTELVLQAAYLYTHVSEGGLALVYPSNGSASPLGSFPTNGMKLGARVKQSDYSYDMALNYTWVYGNHQQNISKSNAISTFDINHAYNNKQRVKKAAGAFNFHFNALKLELGTTKEFHHRILLRPHTGFILLWNDENLDITYDSISRMKQKQNIRGIGIRVGKQINLLLGKGVSLYAEVASSLLWTHYKIDRSDTREDLLTYQAKNFFHTLLPALEGSIGVEYGKYLSNDRLYLFFRLSAEEEVWINHNKFLVRYQDTQNGNLSLASLGIRAGMSF